MRISFSILSFLVSISVFAQEDRDSTLNRCPLFITDTVTSNNFFIERRPCILKVYRLNGDLVVGIDQRDQFLTIFFPDKKIHTGTYKIRSHPKGRSEVSIKYSFRAGDRVSYVDVGSGTVEVTYDKEKEFWKLRVNGLIANLVDRNITYYKVRSDLWIR